MTTQTTDKKQRDFTKAKTPHTYVMIFCVAVFVWILTFLIPAGMFDVHEVSYRDASGAAKSRTVLLPETFRYSYEPDPAKLKPLLEALAQNPEEMDSLGVDAEKLDALLTQEPYAWSASALADAGLTNSVLWSRYGEGAFDTSKKLHTVAPLWGTEDFGGIGMMNFVFEGLVTGDKWGSAVGIVALILVVGGAFGIIMRTGAIDVGIYAFISRTRGLERYALPLLFLLFSVGGATFGMSEECIPFAMVMVPLVIAMGYDSITAVTVTFVASQVGNATSWMNPFGIVIAQGIAGIPVLSGMGFRLVLFAVVSLFGAAYTARYAEKIRKNPQSSVVYETDGYFRERLDQQREEHRPFTLGHKLILLSMLACLVWIVWGVLAKGYYLPEIASQFFVMGIVSGLLAVVFKLNGMDWSEMASSFQKGVADLAGTAIVVGMAKGLLIIFGGSDPTMPTALNTILAGVGKALGGLPAAATAWFMYVFQSLFNVLISSNSGQAALTMPIMAPLADIVGVTRQVACLAYQLGSGFVDAITPLSASLIGVLGVARIDWVKWFKFQIKMQGFLAVLGSAAILIAVAIGYN